MSKKVFFIHYFLTIIKIAFATICWLITGKYFGQKIVKIVRHSNIRYKKSHLMLVKETCCETEWDFFKNQQNKTKLKKKISFVIFFIYKFYILVLKGSCKISAKYEVPVCSHLELVVSHKLTPSFNIQTTSDILRFPLKCIDKLVKNVHVHCP